MKKRAALFFYVVMIALFAAGVYAVLHAGQSLTQETSSTLSRSVQIPLRQETKTSEYPAFILFAARFLLILLTAKIFGKIFKMFHQPKVMGEIIAGIALGPSLLGWVAPDLFQTLFSGSLSVLKILSNTGILVFMFLVGTELDLKTIKNKAQAAVLVSHTGILVPYFLGMLLSLYLYGKYSPSGVSFTSFSLFMGIAMSITAFPVLARILEEKKMTATPLGMTALTCAAADDVTAWSILAGVVGIATSASGWIIVKTLSLTAVFVFVMLFVVRRVLRQYLSRASLAVQMIVMTIVAVVSSFCTRQIGIHALFGAFMAGAICPSIPTLQKKFEKYLGWAGVVLLPLYFALTGLRTQVGLLASPEAWGICFLIIAVAILGKLGGTSLAARYANMSWKDAFSLGALMNTRGLMELVVLNIGYELGILSDAVFAMMVIMALVTTMMAGPLLTLINKGDRLVLPNQPVPRTLSS